LGGGLNVGLIRKNGAIAIQPDDMYCVMAYGNEEKFLMTGALSKVEAEKALEKIVGKIEDGKKIAKSFHGEFVVIYNISHFEVENTNDVWEWEAEKGGEG